MNKELLTTELNQMQLLHTVFTKQLKQNVKRSKKIIADDSAILSPVAKKAQRETFKVVNKARKIYGEFDSIVVETTRSKNSADEKKSINDTQKFYEKKNNEVQNLVGLHKLNGKTKLKLRLYLDQYKKCAYTQKDLDINLIMSDPYAYEIDHIIPISISLDDSYNNKVLVTHKANQEKGNRAPIAAIRSGKITGASVDRYRGFIMNLKSTHKITEKKCKYLLLDKDINRYEEMKEFVNRNLIDTSYANRVVFNTLKEYFLQNDIDTKIHTIRGSATAAFRKGKLGIKKDREENHGHHALDALIVASIKKVPLLNKLLNTFTIDKLYDEATGEVFEIKDKSAYFDESYLAFLATLKNIKVSKYSHKTDTKMNRQISNETIYSTRIHEGKERVVKKYKDIYDPKFMTLAEDIVNQNYETKYLAAIHNPKTFQKFIEIVTNYFQTYKNDEAKITMKKDKYVFHVNPIYEFSQENGTVSKYAKKGTGPKITSLKYLEDQLGANIDISKNYNVHDKHVVMLQLSPYCTDFYQSKEGNYKFVTIRYADIKYSCKDRKYYIPKESYEDKLKSKGIDNSYTFQNSFHRDELIAITKKEGEKLIYPGDDNPYLSMEKHDGKLFECLKFTGTNSDTHNVIEIKPFYKHETKRLMLAVGKKIIKIEKYSTDVLGNLFKVKTTKPHLTEKSIYLSKNKDPIEVYFMH